MKLFFQSFFQVGLVAVSTILITKGYIVGIFTVSFLISLLWAFNVSRVAISTLNQKLTYAFGAGCGSVVGVLILKFFKEFISYLTKKGILVEPPTKITASFFLNPLQAYRTAYEKLISTFVGEPLIF